MATTQTTIKHPNVGWGVQYYKVTTSTTINYQSSSPLAAGGSAIYAWMNFKGITIPQNSNINSAQLNFQATTAYSGTGSNRWLYVVLGQESAPPSPPTQNIVFGAPPVFSTEKITVNDTTATGLGTGAWSLRNNAGTGAYGSYSSTVTTFVQTLVNNYSYDNDNMMFYFWCGTGQVFLYAPGRGATNEPSFVINYDLPPQLVAKTTYVFV